MRVMVEVYETFDAFDRGDEPFVCYVMDHSDPVQRKRLGMSCTDAFEAMQVVVTIPLPPLGEDE